MRRVVSILPFLLAGLHVTWGQTEEPRYFIQEFRVQGSKTLPAIAVEEAVYPYLGRGRTAADVEKARAALEKAYHSKGYQAVAVEIPPQDVAEGVVFLKVSENPVGRLRVNGVKYFSPSAIKSRAPELGEGTVLNFNDVSKAVMRMNRLRDLKVTPELKQGTEPGTVDVDLKVEDTRPLHGSIEINNRHSANTTRLRANGSISYDNLWQAGHTLGLSFQVAPERPEDATVYTGYYLARFKELDWLSLMIQGTKQDSNVSTLGGAAVAGRGNIVGARLLASLPGGEKFSHSISLGIDWKKFDENVTINNTALTSPVEYFPLSANYGASWAGEKHSTDLNLGLNLSLRPFGSGRDEFDNRRYNATGSYVYLRGDLTHTHDLPGGWQVQGKVQGQLTGDNLINAEQYSGGGIGTARGYLESSALGDNVVLGGAELRTPSLISIDEKKTREWRLYVFTEGGWLGLNETLAEQEDSFTLFSVGAGTRFKLHNHFNGSLDAGLPLQSNGSTENGDWILQFRLWDEF